MEGKKLEVGSWKFLQTENCTSISILGFKDLQKKNQKKE